MALTVRNDHDHGWTRADILRARSTPPLRQHRRPQRTCEACGYPLDGAPPIRRYCSRLCSLDTSRDPTKWDDPRRQPRSRRPKPARTMGDVMRDARRQALLESWLLRLEIWFPDLEPGVKRKAAGIYAQGETPAIPRTRLKGSTP